MVFQMEREHFFPRWGKARSGIQGPTFLTNME